MRPLIRPKRMLRERLETIFEATTPAMLNWAIPKPICDHPDFSLATQPKQ